LLSFVPLSLGLAPPERSAHAHEHKKKLKNAAVEGLLSHGALALTRLCGILDVVPRRVKGANCLTIPVTEGSGVASQIVLPKGA
jgi:hypothetical protein